jgi:hypothetical protein
MIKFIQNGLKRIKVMSNFGIFAANDPDAIGFVVNDGYFDRNYFVKINQLRLSNCSFLLRDNYVVQDYEWNNGKTFCWGIQKEETLLLKIERRLNIEEVTEIPEWVGKSEEEARKEIEDHEEEIFKQSWTYKICHLFSKKENK